jgi:YNFM family putative membrane transporter
LNRAASSRTRQIAVMFAGFCAFLQLYATQPILPLLADLFHAGKVAVSLTVTAGGFGVALGAPVAGYLADRVGRKRVILWSAFLLAAATLVTALVRTLPELIFWRFVQGLFTPGIFAVTIAYINDEWAEGGASKALANYVSGTVLGGFSSRMLAGLVAAHWPWRFVFVVLGTIGLAGACALAVWLPQERRHPHAAVEGADWRSAVRSHLHNRQLLATFTVGFCVLFSLVSTFTYVTFYLAEPPFRLQPAALGLVFVVYLVGAAVTPISGRAIDRFGNRRTLAAAIGTGVVGVACTLVANLWMVALGLAICCTGVFLAQASASGFIGIAAKENRALAAGMYASFYHTGGSVGAAIPGFVWALGGWPACVAFIALIQLATVTLALTFWTDNRATPHGEAWTTPAELD